MDAKQRENIPKQGKSGRKLSSESIQSFGSASQSESDNSDFELPDLSECDTEDKSKLEKMWESVKKKIRNKKDKRNDSHVSTNFASKSEIHFVIFRLIHTLIVRFDSILQKINFKGIHYLWNYILHY